MIVHSLFSLVLMAFSLVSLNTGGLRNHTRMYSALHSFDWRVLRLQEANWEPPHVRLGTVFWALGTSHSRGAAIVVNPEVLGRPP